MFCSRGFHLQNMSMLCITVFRACFPCCVQTIVYSSHLTVPLLTGYVALTSVYKLLVVSIVWHHMIYRRAVLDKEFLKFLWCSIVYVIWPYWESTGQQTLSKIWSFCALTCCFDKSCDRCCMLVYAVHNMVKIMQGKISRSLLRPQSHLMNICVPAFMS